MCSMPGEPGIAGVDVTLTGTDDLGNAIERDGADRCGRRLCLRRTCGHRTPTATRSPRRSRLGTWTGSTPPGPFGGDTTVNDVISAVAVGFGELADGNTFGEVLAGSLAGSVFEDLNNDGVLDPGEVGYCRCGCDPVRHR